MAPMLMEEPVIIANGVVLTTGQAMTLRVALENFSLDLKHNGLGDDDYGRKMTKLYQERIDEVREIFARHPAR